MKWNGPISRATPRLVHSSWPLHLAHGKTCDHHICICLRSRRRHNDISAKAHWRRPNRTDALRRDNFFCFCVIACMRLCMCVCVCAHLCVRACKDCLTPIWVGNVICDLEEMELSLIDPLMLFFLRSSLPHLLQQETNTASRLPALKAQGKKKKTFVCFAVTLAATVALCSVFCSSAERSSKISRWRERCSIIHFLLLRYFPGSISCSLPFHSQTVLTPTRGPWRMKRSRFSPSV